MNKHHCFRCGAVILAGRRLNLKCEEADSVAHPSLPSDWRNTEKSIFGEFFFVFNGFSDGARMHGAAVVAYQETVTSLECLYDLTAKNTRNKSCLG